MSNRKFILPAMLLAAAFGGVGAVTLPAYDAAAQAVTPPPPPPPGAPGQHRPHRMHPSHIEGRIAFLKAEFKITPAQEPQFDKVVQAMRQNATERRQAFEQMRGHRDQPGSALQGLQAQARFAEMRAQQTNRYLAAFRPLYDTMPPAQKQAADDLMAPHRHSHHGRH